MNKNMFYLFTLVSLTSLNIVLLWKMAVLIKNEQDTIDILAIKVQEVNAVMKSFNEIFKPEIDRHMRKCLIEKAKAGKESINEHTVDFVTTVGKPND